MTWPSNGGLFGPEEREDRDYGESAGGGGEGKEVGKGDKFTKFEPGPWGSAAA